MAIVIVAIVLAMRRRENSDAIPAPALAIRHSPCGIRFGLDTKREGTVDPREVVVNRPRGW